MDDLLDRRFLQDIGVTLDEATYRLLSEHYEHTLHERVIAAVVQQLSEDQATTLRGIMSGDDAQVRDWLVANVPDLDAIIEEEIIILLGEIAKHADSLNC